MFPHAEKIYQLVAPRTAFDFLGKVRRRRSYELLSTKCTVVFDKNHMVYRANWLSISDATCAGNW